MAASVASTSIKAYASGSTIVIDKPTGLAVGDLMIALVHKEAGDVDTCSLTGWTTIISYDDSVETQDWAYALYKVATAADVSAANFTFTLGETKVTGGAILRVIDVDTTPVIVSASAIDSTNDLNNSYNITVTPTLSSLLIFAEFHQANVTTSAQAIGTSNPTWAEVVDQGDATPVSMAVAWAYRPQITATGNGTSTNSANSRGIGFMIALATAPVTASDTIVTSEARVYDLSLLISDTLALTESITKTVARVYANVVKNVSTWLNTDKT